MHTRIIWAIARKDFLDIWHNKATLGGLIFPIILSLLWLLNGNLVGGQQTVLLIYNPGDSKLEQTVEQVFPNANIVQVGSAADVQAGFGPNGAKVKSTIRLAWSFLIISITPCAQVLHLPFRSISTALWSMRRPKRCSR